MYHLFEYDDKVKALSEAIRVTKQKGIIFTSYCMSDPTLLCYGFKNGNINDLIDKKMVNIENFRTYSTPRDIIELSRKEDIDKLRGMFNVTQLHYIATDGYANHMKETIEQMEENVYQLYIKYHLATCERQDMTGYSHHTLDIFRKD